jgi:hypothetical protein
MNFMRNKFKNKLGQLILSAPLLLTALLLMGCPEPPEFENTPRISFEKLEFTTRQNETNENIVEDVLTLSINFEDGDGDLGLSDGDRFAPFNQYNVPLNENNELIFLGSRPNLPPYNPLDYFAVPLGDTVIVGTDQGTFLVTADTFLIERNDRYYNIFIKTFYNPPGASDFIELKWEEAPYFQTFNGRFPILNTEDYTRPINGTLSYDLVSLGFRGIFRNYPMYIETYIVDRAGNKSNVIQTETIQIIE